MGIPNMTVTEPSEEQLAEQIERENEREAGNGIEDGQDTETGRVAGEDGEGDQRQREPAPKPAQMSPQDQKRIDMANRFKRPGVEVPFDGDMTKEANLYGDVANETLEPNPEAPEPGVPAARVDPAPPAKTITLKVRGKDVTRTEEEWLALATKVEAADSYMEEGRTLLENAKQIRAERAGRDPQHPEDRTGAQDDGQDSDRSEQTRHPGPDLKSVVEKIQFGDPEEAARELGTVINDAASKIANEGHIARLVKNDLARSQADLQAFVAANPDLATDKIANVVIENSVYEIYRDEIRALGVDEAQIPKDPKSLADWHRLYRVHGHTVSKPADVLEKAKAKLSEWRGTSASPKPATPRKEAPRVAVNVDRTERRMAIPQQPSRAVAPRRDAAPVKQESSRKDAVTEMRRARGQPVV